MQRLAEEFENYLTADVAANNIDCVLAGEAVAEPNIFNDQVIDRSFVLTTRSARSGARRRWGVIWRGARNFEQGSPLCPFPSPPFPSPPLEAGVRVYNPEHFLKFCIAVDDF